MKATNRLAKIHSPDNGAQTIDVMRSVLMERFGIAIRIHHGGDGDPMLQLIESRRLQSPAALPCA